LTIPADTVLRVENRTSIFKPNPKGDDGPQNDEERAQQKVAKDQHHKIEPTLVKIPGFQRCWNVIVQIGLFLLESTN
jgi:hypothetical protein